MVSSAQLAAALAASFVLAVIPGPGVLFVIGRALTLGSRNALVSVLSHASGTSLHLIAVAFGVGAVIQRSVLAFSMLKLAGAAYLVYLGVQSIRHRNRTAEAFSAGQGAERTSKVVRQGFLVGVTNPKSVVFYAAVVPQFVDHEAGHVPGQILVLGAVAVAMFIVADALWGLLAGTVRSWFARSPRRLARVGGTGGLAMITLGVTLAFTGRKD